MSAIERLCEGARGKVSGALSGFLRLRYHRPISHLWTSKVENEGKTEYRYHGLSADLESENFAASG